MPVVTSLINLKGGVGKTTITLALAHFLAAEHKKRVLVIDLDPQTNATVCLIPETHWKTRDEAGRTLYNLFLDKLKGTSTFDISQTLVRNVSNVGGGIDGLDLLPSSLQLIKIQERITQITDFEQYSRGPIFALRDALVPHMKNYDYVLIDCPPSLGVVTLNGIAISDSYLIPVIPDALSVLGIPPIMDRIEHFSACLRRNVRALGIVVSKVRQQTVLHTETIRRLREDFYDRRFPFCFESIVPESTHVAEAADVSVRVNTLQQKYGNGGPYNELNALTKEYMYHATRR
jgi:chromosome partitioning protein